MDPRYLTETFLRGKNYMWQIFMKVTAIKNTSFYMR